MTTTYHIGLCRGGAYHGHRTSTVIVQMTRSVDALSCETWVYLGQLVATRAAIRSKRVALLDYINRAYGTAFTALVVES